MLSTQKSQQMHHGSMHKGAFHKRIVKLLHRGGQGASQPVRLPRHAAHPHAKFAQPVVRPDARMA